MILGLELVIQTAALMHPCCVIMFLKVPNLFFNQNSTVSYLFGLALAKELQFKKNTVISRILITFDAFQSAPARQ